MTSPLSRDKSLFLESNVKAGRETAPETASNVY